VIIFSINISTIDDIIPCIQRCVI